MVVYSEPGQRIVRLTPLAEALAAIEARVRPVESRKVNTVAALGRILAADAAASARQPAAALALRDGWAVKSNETADAGSYAPAPLSAVPARVAIGEPVPQGAD
ncbi:MAG: hypothetical protein WEC82_04530, partial [Xanthobacteraceae bacterium]